MKERDNPWFKFFAQYWLDSTRQLSIEQRGAYIDIIAMRMISDSPLDDKNYKWLAHQMHISSRRALALVEGLIAAKRITKTADGITDERCEKEIAARARQRSVNADNAGKRGDKRFENSANDRSADHENFKKDSLDKEVPRNSQSEVRHTRARQELQPESNKEDSPQPPVPGGGCFR